MRSQNRSITNIKPLYPTTTTRSSTVFYFITSCLCRSIKYTRYTRLRMLLYILSTSIASPSPLPTISWRTWRAHDHLLDIAVVTQWHTRISTSATTVAVRSIDTQDWKGQSRQTTWIPHSIRRAWSHVVTRDEGCRSGGARRNLGETRGRFGCLPSPIRSVQFCFCFILFFVFFSKDRSLQRIRSSMFVTFQSRYLSLTFRPSSSFIPCRGQREYSRNIVYSRKFTPSRTRYF